MRNLLIRKWFVPDGIRTRVSALKGIAVRAIRQCSTWNGHQAGHHARLDAADDVATDARYKAYERRLRS